MDLLKTKQGLEDLKIDKAQKEGKLQSLKETMKKDFGVNSTDEAKQKEKDVNEELKQKEEEYTKLCEAFYTKYEKILSMIK